jgi:hypothetical protein
MSSFKMGPIGHLICILLRRRVASGPFAGMKYLRESFGSAYLPKLLGTYEKELWGPWKRLAAACCGGTMVNIGSAEGYYAVGALYSGAFARVVCYEKDARARDLLAKMAQLNGVHHALEMHDHCDPIVLHRSLQLINGPVAIVCDVEGYEDVLLDPKTIGELARCHLLIESHEARCPGVKERLRQRFHRTHQIEFIPVAKRTPLDLPHRPWLLGLFPSRNKLRWLDELRDIDTPWFYLVPRSRPYSDC